MKQDIILIMLSFFCCISCQEKEQDIIHQDIELSKNEVYLWHGQSDSIDILTSNIPYLEASIDNKQIADVKISNNTIIIDTKDIGNATIYIKGTPNYSAKIDVFSCAFDGTWIENIIPNMNMIYKVQVVSDNEAISKQLEQELLQLAQNKFHSIYAFDFNDTPLIAKIRDNNTSSSITYKGTYTYDKINKKLILEYDNFYEEYDIEPYSYNIVQLKQDLTKDYQKEYPNANIKNITLTKFLTKSNPL